jgi:DNA-binding XRE family transcriptional regulator
MTSEETQKWFSKVEELRKHMMLTNSNLAEIIGVSRMTYYSWVKGKPIREKNFKKVQAILRTLLDIMTKHDWPKPSIIALDQNQRFGTLKGILKKYESV